MAMCEEVADYVASEVADKVAASAAETPLVSVAARRRLASIRDEWLAPLVAQLTDQARTTGRSEAERDGLRLPAPPQPASEAPTVLAMTEAPAPPAPAGGPPGAVATGVRRGGVR